MRRPPGEAEERLRWCEGADLSSAEEDLAEFLEDARMPTRRMQQTRTAGLPPGELAGSRVE